VALIIFFGDYYGQCSCPSAAKSARNSPGPRKTVDDGTARLGDDSGGALTGLTGVTRERYYPDRSFNGRASSSSFWEFFGFRFSVDRLLLPRVTRTEGNNVDNVNALGHHRTGCSTIDWSKQAKCLGVTIGGDGVSLSDNTLLNATEKATRVRGVLCPHTEQKKPRPDQNKTQHNQTSRNSYPRSRWLLLDALRRPVTLETTRRVRPEHRYPYDDNGTVHYRRKLGPWTINAFRTDQILYPVSVQSDGSTEIPFPITITSVS